ncbi:unnamed protein product [Rodentolepis nana]|uniref:BESS domain-containing protein n=1 Tax=Rodentolepis nana TaxID=102285 RepID=A0A0R3TX34_RODNA|nr:unnamed protein product [Rodentolepis nana]
MERKRSERDTQKTFGAKTDVLLQTQAIPQVEFERILDQLQKQLNVPHRRYKPIIEKQMDFARFLHERLIHLRNLSQPRKVSHQNEENSDDGETVSDLVANESRTMHAQDLSITAQLDNLSISESAPNNITSESTPISASQIQMDINNSVIGSFPSSDTFNGEMTNIEDRLRGMHMEDS